MLGAGTTALGGTCAHPTRLLRSPIFPCPSGGCSVNPSVKTSQWEGGSVSVGPLPRPAALGSPGEGGFGAFHKRGSELARYIRVEGVRQSHG